MSILLALAQVVSIGQTGGITTNRVENVVQVWNGGEPERLRSAPVIAFTPYRCRVPADTRAYFGITHALTVNRRECLRLQRKLRANPIRISR